ncbi:hypothetical protein CPC08DRAFT_716116 [Agrocybe pediades]|nr:hypothetical protein CPC08DRAFT_716116 [Agrocybe pediades]
MSSPSSYLAPSNALAAPNLSGERRDLAIANRAQHPVELQNLTFVIVGSLGALIWDILSNIKYEYFLLQRSRWSLSTVVYLLARISTIVGFVLGSLLISVDAPKCAPILAACSWMTSTSISLTTLLFFFRVRAVYNNSRTITWIFLLLWLGVFTVCIYQPVKGVSRGHTQNLGKQPASGAETICVGVSSNLVTLITSMSTVPMVYDTLGFCAVSWRIFRNSHAEMSIKDGIRVVLRGETLPRFSRALLRDSQVYFLSTVVLEILTTALFYSPSRKLAMYSTLFVFPNIALMNLMGCRIYRHTKLQLGSYTTTYQFSSIGFRNPTETSTAEERGSEVKLREI